MTRRRCTHEPSLVGHAAPRRLNRKRTATQPRPEEADLVESEADLIRVAWDKPHRVGPF